eukprot:227615-Pelagomonas_calceolata.AAC.4
MSGAAARGDVALGKDAKLLAVTRTVATITSRCARVSACVYVCLHAFAREHVQMCVMRRGFGRKIREAGGNHLHGGQYHQKVLGLLGSPWAGVWGLPGSPWVGVGPGDGGGAVPQWSSARHILLCPGRRWRGRLGGFLAEGAWEAFYLQKLVCICVYVCAYVCVYVCACVVPTPNVANG